MSVGECRRVPEGGPASEEQPDGRWFRPSLAQWALDWDQGERMRTRRRGKAAPDAN